MSVANGPSRPLRRFVLVRLAVLGGAVVAGLLLQRWVGAQLDAIQTLAQTDVLRARIELAQWFRIGGAALFGLTGATGLVIALASRHALAEGRYPTTGILSLGAAGRLTGPAVRRFAGIGIALGIAVVLCSAAGGALTWYVAATLLACRAL